MSAFGILIVSRLVEVEVEDEKRQTKMYVEQKHVENAGIEPATSCMLSTRSTN